MTGPCRALYPCEALAVLGVMLRSPRRAADLDDLGLIGALPAGPPRQVALLLAWYAADVADRGWGVVFDDVRRLRAHCDRLRSPSLPGHVARAFRGRIDLATLASLAAQASIASPALLDDGHRLLDALMQPRLAVPRQPQLADATRDWLDGGARVA